MLVGVGALVFAGVVVGEVVVEVAVGLDGAEFEDGFGVGDYLTYHHTRKTPAQPSPERIHTQRRLRGLLELPRGPRTSTPLPQP